MRESNTSLCVFYIVDDWTADQLLPINQKHINPCSCVICGRHVTNIFSLNVVLNHSLHFVAPERDPENPNIKIHTNRYRKYMEKCLKASFSFIETV
jgi:hypothetical protein